MGRVTLPKAYSAVPLKRGQFSPTSSRQTPQSSPVRARYDVYFVNITSYAHFISGFVTSYAKSCYVGLRYNGTRLYVCLILYQTWYRPSIKSSLRTRSSRVSDDSVDHLKYKWLSLNFISLRKDLVNFHSYSHLSGRGSLFLKAKAAYVFMNEIVLFYILPQQVMPPEIFVSGYFLRYYLIMQHQSITE